MSLSVIILSLQELQCAQCEKSFTSIANLKAHRKKKHGGGCNGKTSRIKKAQFQYDICQKMFISDYNLKIHATVHTGKVIIDCKGVLRSLQRFWSTQIFRCPITVPLNSVDLIRGGGHSPLPLLHFPLPKLCRNDTEACRSLYIIEHCEIESATRHICSKFEYHQQSFHISMYLYHEVLLSFRGEESQMRYLREVLRGKW